MEVPSGAWVGALRAPRSSSPHSDSTTPATQRPRPPSLKLPCTERGGPEGGGGPGSGLLCVWEPRGPPVGDTAQEAGLDLHPRL